MTRSCCSRGHVTCFKRLSQADIESTRHGFYSLQTETEQTQHMLDYMRQHSRGDKTVLYTVAGQEVCEVSFRMAYGLRYNRFMSMKAKFIQGVVVAEHGRLGKRYTGEASIRAISWLRTFVQKVGDHMPTSKDIHLPSCLTKADVYALAADDLTQGGLPCCGVSTFYDVWASEFPHVKIPKVTIGIYMYLHMTKWLCVSISGLILRVCKCGIVHRHTYNVGVQSGLTVILHYEVRHIFRFLTGEQIFQV